MISPGTDAFGSPSSRIATSISLPVIASSIIIHSSYFAASKSAFFMFFRSVTFEIPIEDPIFAGLTNKSPSMPMECSFRLVIELL